MARGLLVRRGRGGIGKIADADQPLIFQPHNRHPGPYRQRPRQMPIALGDEHSHDCVTFARSQRQQMSSLRADFGPPLRTTAAFTLSPAPGALCHLVLTRPETEPTVQFLYVGSHLCARTSIRKPCPRELAFAAV